MMKQKKYNVLQKMPVWEEASGIFILFQIPSPFNFYFRKVRNYVVILRTYSTSHGRFFQWTIFWEIAMMKQKKIQRFTKDASL